jgi:putative pyruvate formate lyase activating enzyme
MRVARVALHFWEEPPISGSAGSGTIFFSHCTLGCVYCQNFAISGRGRAAGSACAGKLMTPADVAQACLDLQNQGAMNINLVTPTHYAPLIRRAISIARAGGLELPVVYNTSGYEYAHEVKANAQYVDIYLTDFKYASNALARAYSAVENYTQVALLALDAMVECAGTPEYDTFGAQGVPRMTRGVIVRHMLLPGHLQDSFDVVKLLAERYGGAVKLSLMNQYTPVLQTAAQAGNGAAARVLAKFPNLAHAVTNEEYERLLDYADSFGLDYFWQIGESAKESFIPNWD